MAGHLRKQHAEYVKCILEIKAQKEKLGVDTSEMIIGAMAVKLEAADIC